MRRLVCVIGALVVTAGAAGASTVPCGLRGTVYVLPGGACLENDCGKKPLANATLMFSAADRAGVKTVTHADGSYRVRLSPGTYTVRLAGEAAMRLSPNRATVVRAKFKTVQFVVAHPRVS
jgi:hypothetical protein